MSSMYLFSYLPYYSLTNLPFTRPVEKHLENEHAHPNKQLLPLIFLKETHKKNNLQRNLAKEQEVRKVFLLRSGNIRKKKQTNRHMDRFPEAYWLQQGLPRVEQRKHQALL